MFTTDGTLLAVREDVGRHNAVDKVIGWALESGHVPLGGTVLLVSGRASFELTQKAVMAGHPGAGRRLCASSLAVDLAGQSGLTLVAFLRGDSMTLQPRRPDHPLRRPLLGHDLAVLRVTTAHRQRESTQGQRGQHRAAADESNGPFSLWKKLTTM